MSPNSSIRRLCLLPVISEQAIDGGQSRESGVTLRRLRELGDAIEESGQCLPLAQKDPAKAHLDPRRILQRQNVARELEDLTQQQGRLSVHRLGARLILNQRNEGLLG